MRGFLLGFCFAGLGIVSVTAQDSPVAQYAKIGLVDAETHAKLSRQCTELMKRAQEGQGKPYLILEISDRPSRYGDVREVAQYLAREIPQIETIAWVPKTLRGQNVIVALACKEIVMHPNAEIGDIGRGKEVDGDARAFVLGLVKLRNNSKVTDAIAISMMDPKEEAFWIRRRVGEPPQDVLESDVVTNSQLEQLIQQKAIIEERKSIRPSGADALFNATQVRGLGVLIRQTAEDRNELLKVYSISRDALRDESDSSGSFSARRIAVEGVINPMVSDFLSRQIRRAVADQTNILVLEFDSAAGELDSCQKLAYEVSSLDSSKIRTIAYIPREATSGVALIALACDEIHLHDNARWGAAIPSNADSVDPIVVENQITDFREIAGEIAASKSRSVGLAQAMVDKSVIVYEARNLTDGKQAFLTEEQINSDQEAWEKKGPLPETTGENPLTLVGNRGVELGMAESVVGSIDELKQKIGVAASEPLTAQTPTWVDRMIYSLNRPEVTGLMFFIGIVCIYAELQVTTGIFGIVAGLCFGLFFWSRMLGGTADWLELMLFLGGVCLILLEIFVVPGFGVFGVAGGVMILAALVFASQTFYLPVTAAEYDKFTQTVGTLSLALVATFFAGAFLSKYLPKSRLGRMIVLVPPGSERLSGGEPQLAPELTGLGGGKFDRLVGQRGVAFTMLRPAGRAKIGDELIDVISEGPFVEPSQPVEVVQVIGNRIIVRAIS